MVSPGVSRTSMRESSEPVAAARSIPLSAQVLRPSYKPTSSSHVDIFPCYYSSVGMCRRRANRAGERGKGWCIARVPKNGSLPLPGPPCPPAPCSSLGPSYSYGTSIVLAARPHGVAVTHIQPPHSEGGAARTGYKGGARCHRPDR